MKKKKDKESLEYLISDCFYYKDITGFQFTAGNTPLGIKQNRPMKMHCSLNYPHSVVIDCSIGDIEKKLITLIFGREEFGVDLEKIRDLQEQFTKLGYEVEEAEFAGVWYWFRVKCTADEIISHAEQLKNNLIL